MLTLAATLALLPACSEDTPAPLRTAAPLAEVTAVPAGALVVRSIEGVDAVGCAQPGPNAITGDDGQSCFHLGPEVIVLDRIAEPRVETVELTGTATSEVRITLPDPLRARIEVLQAPETDEVEAGLLAVLSGEALLGEAVVEGDELVLTDLDPQAVKIISAVPRG